MKSSSLNLLIILTFFELLTAIDICSQNNGNIEISEAFLLEDQLFVFTENSGYRADGFGWTPLLDVFNLPTKIEALDPKIWNFSKLKFVFPIVKYPGEKQRVMAIEWGESDSIKQLKAYLMNMSPNGTIFSKEEIHINVYKCNPKEDPLSFCSLFTKFPEENLQNLLTSISSFPSPSKIGKIGNIGNSTWIPQRLFVYYKEMPVNRTLGDKYKSKRYVFISQNKTIGTEHITDWQIDGSNASKCVDLNGRIVNASTALTPYVDGKKIFDFYWIEFFGTQFKIFKSGLNERGAMKQEIEEMQSGSIGQIFGCRQPTTGPTTGPPLTVGETVDTTIAAVTGGVSDSLSDKPEERSTKTATVEPIYGTDSEEKTTLQEENTTPEGGKSKTSYILLILFILLIVVVVIALIIYFILFQKEGGVQKSPSPPQKSGGPPPAPDPGSSRPVSPPNEAAKESDPKVPSPDKESMRSVLSVLPPGEKKPPTPPQSSGGPPSTPNAGSSRTVSPPNEAAKESIPKSPPKVPLPEKERSDLAVLPSGEKKPPTPPLTDANTTIIAGTQNLLLL